LVRAVASGGRNIQVSAINFVFALGTIEMSRFFLSMKRRSRVPWNDNDLIGAYFQDHLGGNIAKVQVLNEPRFRNFFENGIVSGLKLQPKLRFTPKYRLSVTTGVSGFFNFDSKLAEKLENIKLLIRALRSGVAYSKVKTLPMDVWAVG